MKSSGERRIPDEKTGRYMAIYSDCGCLRDGILSRCMDYHKYISGQIYK